MRSLVHRYPLSVFFVLAYGLSWLAWLPFLLSNDGVGLLDLDYPSVAGTTQLLGILPGAYLGPLAAAFAVTAAAEGRAGLRRWARRLTHWRVGWRWYAAVLTAVPAVILLSTLLLPGAAGGIQAVSALVLLAYLPMLVVQVLTTSLAEEPGWRDFALPRLQRRFGALTGTVVLGLLWGGWHLPLFLTPAWAGPGATWLGAVEFVATCVPISIVMTWVFNRTRQSVPLLMVLHASINSVMSLVWTQAFPALDPSTDAAHAVLVAATLTATAVLLATRGRLGLVPDASAGPSAPARPTVPAQGPGRPAPVDHASRVGAL